MTYTIHTYGNGEIIQGVINALAMCLHGGTETLLEPLKRLGLLIGVFWAAIYALYGDGIKVLTHWIFPMTIMMNLLFVPQASVWIHDPITHFHQKVDHVPYGLAAFAGYVSVIGHTLTVQIEKVFTLPDDLQYHRSGSLFASNLIQKAKTWRITSPAMADNMRGFVEQCVLYDAMLGGKYTLDDLRHSSDIWKLVSTNASPARSFLWTGTPRGGEPRSGIVTCQEGAARLDHMWDTETTRASNTYGRTIFPHSSGSPTSTPGLANTELLRYLPLAYQVLGNIQQSASDILKQNMMIYAVMDGVEGKSTELGNAPNFAARRAYLQQRSTYETLGAMAGEMLPTMKAVLEAIAYACFLFVIPMCLLPFGWTFLLRWGQILLWLQMWAPLSAVLNYVMTMAARNQSLAVLDGNPEGAVSIATSAGLCDANADMAAMAGYLAMSLPFLSIALVKGVGSFVHMATHLGNVSQSAAGVAAGEVTSGNLNYGNIHEGNVQIGNTNMLQQGRTARLSSGAVTFDDGRVSTTYTNQGEAVSQVGISSLPVSINMAETQSQQLSEAATQHIQTGFQLAESSASHIASSYRQMADLSESFSHDEGRQHALSQGVTQEQMESTRKAVSLVQSYAREKNISTDQAAGLFASTPLLGGNISLSESEREQLSDAKKYADEHHFDESTRQAINASQTLAESSGEQNTKKLAESIAGSWERGMAERQEASKNFSQAESFNRSAQHVLINASTINRNASQELLEFVATSPSTSLLQSTSLSQASLTQFSSETLNNNHEMGRNHEVGEAVVGHRGAVHILSRDDEVSRGYIERFMENKRKAGLVPASSAPQSNLEKSYQANQHHARYRSSSQDMNQVANQGRESMRSTQQSSPAQDSNVWPFNPNHPTPWEQHMTQEKSPTSQQGDFRSNATQQQNAVRQDAIRQEGEALKQEFKEKANKSPIRRVYEKVDNTVFNKEEAEQNIQPPRLKGEPQQG